MFLPPFVHAGVFLADGLYVVRKGDFVRYRPSTSRAPERKRGSSELAIAQPLMQCFPTWALDDVCVLCVAVFRTMATAPQIQRVVLVEVFRRCYLPAEAVVNITRRGGPVIQVQPLPTLA